MSAKNIVAIIQARLDSIRLKEKVLLSIEHKAMLWHVAKRISASKLVDKIIIATSLNSKDDKIEQFAKKNNLNIFRGSEENCLDRYYQAAKEFNTDIIVRITADCPLICPEIVDNAISEYLKNDCDYVTNTLIYTYPDGCDVEVFSMEVLEKAWRECKDLVEKEHVTSYIKNSGKFKIKNIRNKYPVPVNEHKWSVDRIEDLKFVREIYKHLYKNERVFLYHEIMNLLKQHPELKQINSKFIINEGYYKSILKAPKIKPKKVNIKNSIVLRKKAEDIIPGCSQTFSKGPSQFVQSVAPVFLEKGKGCYIWDVDGNRYTDYAMALGSIILGHTHPSVTNAVKNILRKSTNFTLPHKLETELAELLCNIIPCAEMIRFGKNGSDATSGAVRVARAYTGREKIACCGYHGWQDWYIGTTTRNKGVPEAVKKQTLTFEYNNIRTLENIFKENKGEISCVIMEPMGVNEPQDCFLHKIKELTHKNGAVLIFDEIVTGFRLSLGGAQEYFNVLPDIACFGKGMGNGFPISAIVGRREIMKLFEEVFYSFTFGGEIVAISAAIATIKELKEKNVIQYIWEQGRKITEGFQVLAKEYSLEKHIYCTGLPPRTLVTFKNENGEEDLMLKSLFQQECIKRNILFTGSHNICFSHSNKDIDYALRVYSTVLEIIAKAIKEKTIKKLLKGKPVQPVFRKVT